MSSSPLDPARIAQLLKEEAQAPTRGHRGPKVDPTDDRSVQGWFRLQHHICTRDCPHRVDVNNSTFDGIEGHIGNACWNPNCLDKTRNKETDRGANVVYNVKGQQLCRYCYLGGYLKE